MADDSRVAPMSRNGMSLEERNEAMTGVRSTYASRPGSHSFLCSSIVINGLANADLFFASDRDFLATRRSSLGS